MKSGVEDSKKRACLGNFCASASGNCASCEIDKALDELEATGRIIVKIVSASSARAELERSDRLT